MDQQQETKERGGEEAREERRLESVRLIGKHRKQHQNWHPALLSPYTCKLSLTSLDEEKLVQSYSGKASECKQEVK